MHVCAEDFFGPSPSTDVYVFLRVVYTFINKERSWCSLPTHDDVVRHDDVVVVFSRSEDTIDGSTTSSS